MATKNIRIVGYLRPPYHQKLREFMTTHSLSESAALVHIVKEFFDGVGLSNDSESRLEDQLASLKQEMAQMQQRLGVLEAALSTQTRSRSHTPSRNLAARRAPTLPPQTLPSLARRLGVTSESLEEAKEKGEGYFHDWTKRRDPGSRAWIERDELFHPL